MTATTVTTTRPAPTDRVGTTTVFRRSAAAEWTRLWSIRSTWWAMFAAASMVLLVAVAFGLDQTAATPVWIPGNVAVMFTQFALLIPAMLAVTSEHATGSIRPSLQAVPRRGVLIASRMVVSVVVASVATVVLVALSAVVAGVLLGASAEVVLPDIARNVGLATVVVAASTIVAAGLGAALRSAAGTLTSVFLLVLVLPMVLPQLGVSWLVTASEHLPGNAALSLLNPDGLPTAISTGRAITVLVAWCAAATAAGAWSALRRDA